MSLVYIIPFIFGTLIGSFLNVVAIRWNSGAGLHGRSKCMSCGHKLSWYELVPVFSFLIQGGKCRHCSSKISWQYATIEFLTGLIFLLIFYFYPPIDTLSSIETIIYLVSSCLLLVITIYDIKHKVIPDSLSYSFSGLALISIFLDGGEILSSAHLWQIVDGVLLALPFALLWLVSQGRWMGLGDAKLIVGIGWLLGFAGGVNALVLAFWIAAAVSVFWIFLQTHKFKPKMEIPFGPYLILGLYLVLFFNINVLDVNSIKDILLSYF